MRKHILSTNKHPGKFIYECKFCDGPQEYATNFAKDFKIHLVTEHGDQFGSSKIAASYIMGIYNAEEDPQDPKITYVLFSRLCRSKSWTASVRVSDPQIIDTCSSYSHKKCWTSIIFILNSLLVTK